MYGPDPTSKVAREEDRSSTAKALGCPQIRQVIAKDRKCGDGPIADALIKFGECIECHVCAKRFGTLSIAGRQTQRCQSYRSEVSKRLLLECLDSRQRKHGHSRQGPTINETARRSRYFGVSQPRFELGPLRLCTALQEPGTVSWYRARFRSSRENHCRARDSDSSLTPGTISLLVPPSVLLFSLCR
jgi:hypothetical protein